mgnify:CR=1 FL=1
MLLLRLIPQDWTHSGSTIRRVRHELSTRTGNGPSGLQSLKILMATLLAFGFALISIFLFTSVNSDNPSVGSFDDEGPPLRANAAVVRQPDSEVRRRLAGFYSSQDSTQTAFSEISVSEDSEFRNRPMIRVPTGSRANETLRSNAMPHRANDPRLRLC